MRMTYLKITKGFELNRLFKLNIEQHWPWVFSYTMVYYTPVSDIILFFSQSHKTFWLSKISTNLAYMQSFRQIGSKLWKIGAIQNRYPIVVQ